MLNTTNFWKISKSVDPVNAGKYQPNQKHTCTHVCYNPLCIPVTYHQKPSPFFFFMLCCYRLCCSYGLFDFEYMHQCQGTSESSKKQKLFLMSWCPDTAKVSLVLYIQQNLYNNVKNYIFVSLRSGQEEDVVLQLL